MIKFVHRKPQVVAGLRAFSTAQQKESVTKPDVCIVGAGPAGAALACALATSDHFNSEANSSKRIVLIDPSKLPSM